MGVSNVQTPYAANLRSIKRMREEARQEQLGVDRASKRRWKEDLRASSKEASASARAAEKELRADTLWRQVKAHFEPKGRGKINKFLWHGELPEGGPIKPQPPPGATIKEKKTKPLTAGQAYSIALKGEPVVHDETDANLAMIQKQLQEQVAGMIPGEPDVPLQGPQHYQGQTSTRQPIPQAPPQQPGATGVGGPLPFAQQLPGGQGYDITAPAQAMLAQMPDPSAGQQQVPLQHLYKQIGAMGGGGKGGGKSKMDDLTGFAQALDLFGMPKPTRGEMASIFGASKGGTTMDRPPGGIKGEGGGKVAAPPAGGKPTQPQRRRLTSMKAMTADPMLIARITQQLAELGMTLKDVQVDEKGVPFVIDPDTQRVMRFTQIEGVK